LEPFLNYAGFYTFSATLAVTFGYWTLPAGFPLCCESDSGKRTLIAFLETCSLARISWKSGRTKFWSMLDVTLFVFWASLVSSM
jgi:hypothetical protein